MRTWGVMAPHWLLSGVLAALPSCRLAAALRSGRRRRRDSAGAAARASAMTPPQGRDGAGRLSFRLAVTSSLMLLAATLLLWHRSTSTGDTFKCRTTARAGPSAEHVHFRQWGASSGGGSLGLHYLDQHPGGGGAGAGRAEGRRPRGRRGPVRIAR